MFPLQEKPARTWYMLLFKMHLYQTDKRNTKCLKSSIYLRTSHNICLDVFKTWHVNKKKYIRYIKAFTFQGDIDYNLLLKGELFYQNGNKNHFAKGLPNNGKFQKYTLRIVQKQARGSSLFLTFIIIHLKSYNWKMSQSEKKAHGEHGTSRQHLYNESIDLTLVSVYTTLDIVIMIIYNYI